MHKASYTYRISLIIAAVCVWELLFWLLGYQLLKIYQFSSDSLGEKIIFISPQFAWLGILLPIYWVFYFMELNGRNSYVRSISTPELVKTFLTPVSSIYSFVRYFLIRNVLVLLVIAAMQPSFGNKLVTGKASGVELVFAVDVSQSLNAKDMSDGDSRLQAAKRAMTQLMNTSSSAKVGILIFAGSVYPQLPLTADKSAAKMFIEELSTDLISNQGTNIAVALENSAEYFSTDKLKKVVVLITDGEDHEGGVKASIEVLKEKGIELAVLGLGSKNGALVPVDPTNKAAGYLKSATGQSVISKVNPVMLTEIAKQAEGKVVVTSDAFPNVNPLLTQINNLKSTKPVDLEFEVKENRYRLPLGFALFCLMILLMADSLRTYLTYTNEK
ncbi:MAG: VWA domain-containing protein [Crocinitomicaceae bacterium]|nr:VWA domain-containing protein [Crocinitomicaceae bacterium]